MMNCQNMLLMNQSFPMCSVLFIFAVASILRDFLGFFAKFDGSFINPSDLSCTGFEDYFLVKVIVSSIIDGPASELVFHQLF